MIIEISGREIDRIQWALNSKIREQRELVASESPNTTFVENVVELEAIRDKMKKCIVHLLATKWNYGKNTPRRNLIFIDGDKTWEESFIEYMEEFPFDPSAPAEHFMTEQEFDESLEKYRNERERDAFRAGFAAGQAFNNEPSTDIGREVRKSGSDSQSQVVID